MARRKSPLPPSPRVIQPNPYSPSPNYSPNRTTHQVRTVVRVKRVLPPPRTTPLQEIEDRRRWHPAKYLAPAQTLSRRDQRRLVERSRPTGWAEAFPSLRLGFAVPKKVAVCVRRKSRREVIHALKLTGKGGAARRRRKSTFTDIRC